MTSRLPTFATSHGGPAEMIENGIFGYHIDQPDEAAQAIGAFFEQYKRDPEIWTKVSETGLKRVYSSMFPNCIDGKLRDIYILKFRDLGRLDLPYILMKLQHVLIFNCEGDLAKAVPISNDDRDVTQKAGNKAELEPGEEAICGASATGAQAEWDIANLTLNWRCPTNQKLRNISGHKLRQLKGAIYCILIPERNMPGHRPPCSPSLSWGGKKRRSGLEHRRQEKQGRVRGHGSRVVDAGVLDVNNVVAALPLAPQDEAGPDSAEGRMEFVVNETGLASEEAVAHRSDPQQEIRVEANARQPAPRADLTREFSSEQRSLNLRTDPVVEDANHHEVLKSQLMQFRFTKEGKLDYPAAPPTLHRDNPRVTKKRHIERPKLVQDYNLRAKQAAAAAAATENQPAAGARSLFRPSRGGSKPNSSTLSTFLLANEKFRPIPYKVPENYSRPPPPFDFGKVSHVNICPVCEKYTVTELDRSAVTVPSTGEALRARFKCGLCREVFDLGIALFDPRGIPGVTLYEGEDRYRPPVPPQGKYPCPRCWKTTHTSFQCMASYLREESKVQCEPACPAERLNLSSWGKPEEEKIQARNIIRTVLGLS